MVSQTDENAGCASPNSSAERNFIASQAKEPSTEKISKNDSMQIIRQCLEKRGFQKKSIEIISASWRPSTTSQYAVYIRKWCDFCRRRKINPLSSDEVLVVDFLTELFNVGLSYSALNTARSALSTFLWNGAGVTVGKYAIIKKFLKGTFELRPSVPKYEEIWDVKIVLDYLKFLPCSSELSLNVLTHKLVMLLALVTGQRVQTLSFLKIDNILIFPDKCVLLIDRNTKNSFFLKRKPIFTIKRFEDVSVCPVTCLEEYIKRTAPLRHDYKQLFISYIKPHKPVRCETISRWLKQCMFEAGIDVEIFKGHSTRAASTSAAKRVAVDINDIIKTAGWTNVKTFAVFYDKPFLLGGRTLEKKSCPSLKSHNVLLVIQLTLLQMLLHG